MKNFIYKNLLVIVVIIIAAALRFYRLGDVPQGVTHDELGYIFNAFSVAKTGKNVFGEQLPLFTWMVQGGFPFLPVPIYTGAFFFLFFPLTTFFGRFPSALLSVLDVLLLYLLVVKLFKDKPLAILSCFFLAISPWHLHFSRSAYDPNFSLFFYLLAMVAFIYEADKKRLPIISTVGFLLAVFSYRGMNVIFLPLFLLLLWYVVVVYKIKPMAIVYRLLGLGIVLFFFCLTLISFGKSYTQEAMFFNDPKIQESVDKEIREAKGPLIVRRIFLNKPTYLVAKLRENYLRSYSPEFLFLYTEPHKIYSIWSRGRIYFIDLFFLLVGAVFLFLKKRTAGILIVGAVLLGGLPGLMGGMPYSARNYFISVFLPVLTAAGVILSVRCSKSKMARISLSIFIILIYAYSLGSYLFDYYGRYSYQGAEAWAKSLKDISVLAGKRINTYDKITIGNTSFGDLVQFALYNKISPQDVQKSWRRRNNEDLSKGYTLNNVYFKSDCDQFELDKSVNVYQKKNIKELIIVRGSCTKDVIPDREIKDYYGNTIWKVYIIE